MIDIPPWPPSGSVFFVHAAQCFNAWLSLGATTNLAIAMLTQAEFESAFKWDAVGDHHSAYNLYQWHWLVRGLRIARGTGIDVRHEQSIKQVVAAAWWELNTTHVAARDAILAATTVKEAAMAACAMFEGAGAPDAKQRRALGATRWLDWIARNTEFINTHKVTA